MDQENPPIVETCDPRGCPMKWFFAPLAVFAWQGCDKPMDNVLSWFCGCLFAFCCWKPGPRQKKFKPLGQEKVCCFECNPQACCFRCCCPPLAIYSWQGCDKTSDCVICTTCQGPLALFLSIYTAFCWKPAPQQKVWGGKAVVGQAVAADTNYGTQGEDYGEY